MFIQIVKIKVFINLLLAMKRRCKASDRCKLIWSEESTLTLFEIFKPHTFHIHRMPVDLAISVMCMPMECRNNALQMEGNRFRTKRTLHKGLDEATHYVVTKSDIGSIQIKEPINNSQGILHPVREFSINCQPNGKGNISQQLSTPYHVADYQEVAMTTYSNENSRNGK